MVKLKSAIRSVVRFCVYGCCGNSFLLSLQSNITRFWKTWEKRVSSIEEARNYWTAEWYCTTNIYFSFNSFFSQQNFDFQRKKLLVVTIWVCLNIALFIEACYRWFKRADEVISLNSSKEGWQEYTPIWVMIARGFGQLLNLNCSLIILVPMRTLSNILRTLKIGSIVPLDKNIIFHRYLAYWIAICTIGHTLAHYMNYSCCYELYRKVDGTAETSSWRAAWGNRYGLTGNILVILLIIMYGASTTSYRRSNNFTVFWYIHHLYLVVFCCLLIHGKQFWMWFLGPLSIYILERMLRIFRGCTDTIVKRVHGLPSNVVHLELEKPGFVYHSGQYCFLNCPLISKHEWHPFTISSAPEEENLSFHIRVAGDWTTALKNLFVPSGEGVVVLNKPTTPDGSEHLLRVDGPFGTAAEYVFNYEYVMLVAAGIGVTPYASLLKHMRNRLIGNKSLKTKKCFFYWINRDKGSWEWFSELLDTIETEHPDFFQIHTFMTGELNLVEIRAIIDRKCGNTGRSLVRAQFNFDPQCSDEIQIQEGDEIEVLEEDCSGWWKGTNLQTEETGLFPSNHVVTMGSSTEKTKDFPNRKYGRPNWHSEFANVRQVVQNQSPNASTMNRAKVGIFICGPPALSKQLYQTSITESKNSSVLFQFHKENF